MPTPQEIREARLAAGLTQKEAGALVMVNMATWRRWETDIEKKSSRPIPQNMWELFLLKTKKPLNK